MKNQNYNKKGIERVLYMYPNKQDNERRVTVAGALKGDQLRIGITKQRPGEPFNRKIGRGIALGRAVSSPNVTIDLNRYIEDSKVSEKEYNTLVEDIFTSEVISIFSDVEDIKSFIP